MAGSRRITGVSFKIAFAASSPILRKSVLIDPNIIDNLTVLKDASAVAIYGARGSNGVILIQTKQGKLGKPQVNYKGQLGMAEPMQYIEVMGPNEYIRFQQDISRLKDGASGDRLLCQVY